MHTLRCVSNACTLIAHSFLVSPGSKSRDLHLPWYSLSIPLSLSLSFSSTVFCSLYFVSSVYKTIHLAVKRFSISPPIYTHSVLHAEHEWVCGWCCSRCIFVPPLYYCSTTASIRSSKWTQYIIIFFLPCFIHGLDPYACVSVFVWIHEIHPQISVQTTQ